MYHPRRSHTYDHHQSGPSSYDGHASAQPNRSQSVRQGKFPHVLLPPTKRGAWSFLLPLNPPSADIDTANPDPPLPSYDALMAAEQSQSRAHSRNNSFEGGSDTHRLSGGSFRRPLSDPNAIDFSQLSLNPQHQQQQQRGGPNPAASVYSLDSGIGAYQQEPYYAAQPDFTNPYYSAASELLGPPPGAMQPQPLPPQQPMQQRYAPSAYQPGPPPISRQSTLARTNTSVSAMSSNSSMSRKPIEDVGASSTRRRGIDVNKPPYTKQYVDDYRKRMKDDPDPEAQYNYAKYLIEAAKKLGEEISHTDAKLGRRYRDSLLQESLRVIKKLAEGKEPYPDAQFFLANLYGTGQLGLQVDHEKAYYLYLMASKLNHPAATYRSAVCNEIGAGTRKDVQRAVLFYRKAAALGDTAAMYKLGMILLGGLLSQPRNLREAIAWLQRAAAQADEDNPHALHELAMLHERPQSQIVMHNPLVALDLYMQAAQLGYAPSQFKLGSCHEFGHLGCPIDPRKSIAWYTRAAERGDSEAELALSGWYLTGSGEFCHSQSRTNVQRAS